MPADRSHRAALERRQILSGKCCLVCQDLAPYLQRVLPRVHQVATLFDLNFARADIFYKDSTKMGESELHRYIEASSKSWQSDHDGEQIPPSQMTAELTVLAGLLREKCALNNAPIPSHPLPIALPAQRNRLDHIPHREGASALSYMQSSLSELYRRGLDELGDDAVLGCLCAGFALECGVLNLHEQRSLARSLSGRIHATAQWWHLDLQLFDGKGEKLELRRVFLHPIALALYVACVQRLSKSSRFSPATLSGASDSKLNSLLNRGLLALCKAISLPQPNTPKTLTEFLGWAAAQFRAKGMPLLEAYATRDVIAHSVPLNVFRRWHGLAAIDMQSGPDAAGRVQKDVASPPEESGDAISGSIAQRRLDDIRRIFRDGSLGYRQRAAVIERLVHSWPAPPQQNLLCLIDFGLAAEAGRIKSFKKQKGISVSHLLRAVAASWLSGTDGVSLNALTQSDIEGVCADVLDKHSKPGARKRIGTSLRLFLAYLEQEAYLVGLDVPDIPRATGLLSVSANVATPEETDSAVQVMESASTFATLQERRAAAAMVDIAANCGLRRNECLHLLRGDLHLRGEAFALVRPNSTRELKTAGSTRLIPLELATRTTRDRLSKLAERSDACDPVISVAIGATTSVYEWRFFPQMNRSLKQAIGDNGFHFHHLRHSAATWLLVSLLADDLDIHRYADRAPYLVQPLRDRRKNKQLLTANAGPTRKALYAVSLLLGHSSPAITLEHYIHCIDLLLHAHYDSSEVAGTAQQIAGLLSGKPAVPLRNIQRWLKKGTNACCSGIENRCDDLFSRNDAPLKKQRHVVEAAGDTTPLFDYLERHWLVMSREQRRRQADPHRIHRPPSYQIGELIDALNYVDEIETAKRGCPLRTHGLKAINKIALPSPLQGNHPRGTALFVSQMLQDAFMTDFQAARAAVTIWNENTGKVRGFFRLNADTNGEMQWLLESGCLVPAWYEWGDEHLDPIERPEDHSLRVHRPAGACYFRLSRPKEEGAPRTERKAIWWVLSLSYALVRTGVL